MAELDKTSMKESVLDWEAYLSFTYYASNGGRGYSFYRITNSMLYGSGIQWETAVTGEVLKYGEFIPDKVTIEFKEENIDNLNKFIDFNKGFIQTIMCKRPTYTQFSSNNRINGGLLIEDVNVNKDTCIVKITAYSINKYFDKKIFFNKMQTSNICYRNRRMASTKIQPESKNYPSLFDICVEIDHGLADNANSITNGYVNPNGGLKIYRDGYDMGGASVYAGGLNFLRKRYYIKTDKEENGFITLKELISMFSERFGTFCRLKTVGDYSNGNFNFNMKAFLSMNWFDRKYLMNAANSLNNRGGYTRSVDMKESTPIIMHKPCTHIIADYFNANVDPIPQELTTSVFSCKETLWADRYHVFESDKEPKERSGVTDRFTNYRNERAVIGIKNNIISCTDETYQSSSRPPCMLNGFNNWDVMDKYRESARFGGNQSVDKYTWDGRSYSLDRYEYNESTDVLGGSKLIYYAGTIELPLDVYIHPGDAMIVLVKGRYYPMLVGKVEAGSDGKMKITSPPLERFKTDEDFEKEYPNMLYDGFPYSEQDSDDASFNPEFPPVNLIGPDGETYEVINYDKSKKVYWIEQSNGKYKPKQDITREEEGRVQGVYYEGIGQFYIVPYK